MYYAHISIINNTTTECGDFKSHKSKVAFIDQLHCYVGINNILIYYTNNVHSSQCPPHSHDTMICLGLHFVHVEENIIKITTYLKLFCYFDLICHV